MPGMPDEGLPLPPAGDCARRTWHETRSPTTTSQAVILESGKGRRGTPCRSGSLAECRPLQSADKPRRSCIKRRLPTVSFPVTTMPPTKLRLCPTGEDNLPILQYAKILERLLPRHVQKPLCGGRGCFRVAPPRYRGDTPPQCGGVCVIAPHSLGRNRRVVAPAATNTSVLQAMQATVRNRVVRVSSP
jgi:hypothetical protein